MIVVNCRFLSQKVTGTQKFAIEICRELKKQDKNIVFVSNLNIKQKNIAKELDVKIVGNKSYYWFNFFRFPANLLWEQIILPIYLIKEYPNAKLLNLINLAPIFYNNNIVVLHDVAFKKYPNFYKKTFLLVYNILIPIILKRAKMIFTVSEFSKSEIIKFFKINSNKIDVIYNAVDTIKHIKKTKKQNYILAVGSLEPRKNISRLIKSVTRQDIRLIVVGEKNSKVFNQIDLEDSNNIEFTGYLNEKKLNELYSNASAFIYPSIYEGFGIPPLEAQSFGIPVIVSDIEVFHEIYGNSVLYVNPHDNEDILKGIERIIEDKILQNNLIEKGYKNVNRYSWKQSTRKILRCLKQQ